MPCGVNSCSINDNHFLWKCEFCNKTYHAACVGVQRHREHFITAFMTPMCADCQPILRREADVRKLLYQQEQLVEAIRSQTDANHRIAADLKKFCLVSDLTDSIDSLLKDVQETLEKINKNNQSMCTAVGQHIKTCDSQMHTTIAGITDSNLTMSQKITKHIDERLSNFIHDMALSSKEAEIPSPHLTRYDEKLLEILEEVKAVTETVSSLQTTSPVQNTPPMTLEQELAESSPNNNNNNNNNNNTTAQPKNDHSCPGWRFLGNKWHWKQDWTKYDAKQRTRRIQEKAAEKAKRRRKHKQHQFNHTRSQHLVNKTDRNNHENQSYLANGSDKQLLATAKVQFAGPPSTTDHPIAALSVPKFINFRKGETINPYRTEKQAQHFNNAESPTPESGTSQTLPETISTPGLTLDPMRPPIVNLTQQSADGDGRFLKARLRDPKIMHIVRLYLAYLHDKDPSFCHEGMTNTSVKIKLSSEGLPTSPGDLRKIFFEVHEEYSISQKAASDDLDSYRRHLNNERIQHLQRIRESSDRFHNPNFRK